MRDYYVYILASPSRTLYIGMTNNLQNRLYQHKTGEGDFTSRYNITRLVYFETTNSVHVAIAREKELKAWRREKKIALIEHANPTWDDLARLW